MSETCHHVLCLSYAFEHLVPDRDVIETIIQGPQRRQINVHGIIVFYTIVQLSLRL